MASRALIDGRASALPLDIALSVIPSLPRALLSRFVARAIERLDELDGDAEAEADPFNEGEPIFEAERLAMVNQHADTDPNHDAEPDDDAEAGSWAEAA